MAMSYQTTNGQHGVDHGRNVGSFDQVFRLETFVGRHSELLCSLKKSVHVGQIVFFREWLLNFGDGARLQHIDGAGTSIVDNQLD